MTIGVAIIGSGLFVKLEHIPAVQAIPDLISLKAVYSRSLKSAEKVTDGLEGVDLYSEDAGEGKGYGDVLAREDVQAVIIALPILNQPAYIKKALEAGKHVLAEKPIAKDVRTAKELIGWYTSHVDTANATWGVAENFRFLDSLLYASEQVRQLGRVLGFRVRVHNMTKSGGMWYETEWRKEPGYQGGFILDGGVHDAAGARLLLGSENAPTHVSAFTTQLQPHLPPVDTLDAIWKLNSGVSGTFSLSFGTTFSGKEYAVACEKGTVFVTKSKVVVNKDGNEETNEFPDEGAGVKQEVKAWAEGIKNGKQNPRQLPAQALQDLILIESMLQSGERSGETITLLETSFSA
ncbi:NAD(P)-binding protein [Patellaria atrata CBS 101060]|uniref:NAD(P)-binding protein n=1 Tax=Patellaria atrata CBS 101060 TaxID=1346257 RepID=A0A9P4VM38_9PEZI|nr:NAD(P)-binding protein [Patellaria atrata CBS 101060]